ncbi:zinc ribbon domain-containing protein [Pseudomonadales bacterium]|nr:zinc ribbon domain-containing protein [Pseudomonadales bacterium]
MPIYEYQCEACHHKMEALQKMADAPLTDCPACQQSSLKKLISAAAFKLKGSGWYETDFKNNNKPAADANKTSADKTASE